MFEHPLLLVLSLQIFPLKQIKLHEGERICTLVLVAEQGIHNFTIARYIVIYWLVLYLEVISILNKDTHYIPPKKPRKLNDDPPESYLNLHVVAYRVVPEALEDP